jgi:hypothetical protein
MSHLKANEVSVRSRAKANAEFGFLGFTHFPGLVCPDTISRLNAQAKEAVYTKIFNKFQRSDIKRAAAKAGDSKRAAAKAGSLGDCVVLEVLAFLTSILIAGRDHKIEMARGASFLRSLHGAMQQDIHTDFDFEDSLVPPGFRRCKPFSIWIALSNVCRLVLGGQERQYKAGDVVIFAGDSHHAGAANLDKATNYRLFCYVPTREFDVPWAFSQCATGVQRQADAVVSVQEVKWLHQVTNPVSRMFDPAEHLKYLYDRETATFYRFSVPLWLGGLVTAEPKINAYAPGLPSLPADSKHCPHFNVGEFIPNSDERTLLNDFRAQCSYCTSAKAKKRVRSE